MSNLETDLIDLMDTLEFTISKNFLDKWKFKYGERIIRLFQIKILDSLKKQKPLKLKYLVKFLVVDSGFNVEVVKNFFEDIDFEIYYPIISGTLRDAIENE
jgi:hypothetical protein